MQQLSSRPGAGRAHQRRAACTSVPSAPSPARHAALGAPRRSAQSSVTRELPHQSSQHQRATRTAAAAVEAAAKAGEGTAREGSLVVTFDNTQSAEDALKWTMAALYYPGDHVDLVHVVCDPAAMRSPTSVGTTASGRSMSVDTMTNSGRPGEALKDYESRLKQRAEEAVQQRCSATLATVASKKVHLPRIDSPRSASVIGERVIGLSTKAGGRLLVVASHGPGALAEYGSVARYMFQHSKLPLVLVPAGVPTTAEAVGKEVVMVVARLSELEHNWQWVADNLCRKGDILRVWHVLATGTTAAGPSATLVEQLKGRGIADVKYETMHAVGDPSEEASQIIEATNTPSVKTLVCVNYSVRGLIQEAMYGSLASHLSRASKKPLVLLQPTNE